MSATVIAVSAPPGGGKSTFSRALAAALPGAAVVEYDAYDQLTSMNPAEIAAWLAEGGSYERIDVPELVADLEALVSGGAIVDRATGRPIRAERFVVLETPFGRAHPQTAPLIGLSVFLDTPADVALARKVQELTVEARAEPGNAAGFVDWLNGYLGHYLAIVRPAVAIQRERVLPLAELVIPLDTATGDAVAMVAARLAERGLIEGGAS